MDSVRIELNKEGVRELLRSAEMGAICKELADAAQAKCGKGFAVTTMVGKNRVNASIKAETNAAKRKNAKNNTILRSLK